MNQLEYQALMETVRELTRELSAMKVDRNLLRIENEDLKRQLADKEEEHGTND